MKRYIDLIEKTLDEYIPIKYPEEIYKSMRYSVLAGGKRLRPTICLETCKIFGGNIEDALPIACAIEMLHVQSLIHDDLPCIDNDDYRRGKLSNHKAFSESTAVLAGDALISYAIQTIIEKSKNLSENKVLKLIKLYTDAAGVNGIIAGQIVDIQSEGKKIDEKTLEYIHTHKTADMFRFAFKAGGVTAGVSDETLETLDELGIKLGFAFQICDDILDETSTFEEMGKTLGKDEAEEKSTYTRLFGLKNAECKVNCLIDECYDILGKHNIKSNILEDIFASVKRKAKI
ncbi:polyprenyl synthetase family protein [bacterium]|nr:polyprenyl synthetase family protein [bacterium]